MSIFAPALGALWEQLQGYGIDPEPLFREEGIDPEMLFDSGARTGPLSKARCESCEIIRRSLFWPEGR